MDNPEDRGATTVLVTGTVGMTLSMGLDGLKMAAATFGDTASTTRSNVSSEAERVASCVLS